MDNPANQLLDSILVGFKRDGYTVIANPSPSLLPAFMESYVPDAIAFGSDETRARGLPPNVAVEIVGPRESNAQKISDLKAAFDRHSEWVLRLYYLADSSEKVASVSDEAIASSTQRVRDLAEAGQNHAGLLLGWGTLEAAGRGLRPRTFLRPQTPARLLDQLAQAGEITPSEADMMRGLAKSRNAIVHGALDTPVADEDLNNLVGVLEKLLARLRARRG